MKYYKKDGCRFVQIENLYGMYANRDGSFSTVRLPDSYGVVVIHNFKEIVIAHLAVISKMTWREAKRKEYKLPSRLQLLAAYELKDILDQSYGMFWTNEETFDGNYAYYFYYGGGMIDYGDKDHTFYVREFTTIKL